MLQMVYHFVCALNACCNSPCQRSCTPIRATGRALPQYGHRYQISQKFISLPMRKLLRVILWQPRNRWQSHTVPLPRHCLNVGTVASGVNWLPFEGQGLWRSGFGPANARDELVMEAATQIDILGEIADLDPNLEGLVEKCCEWLVFCDCVQDDAIHYGTD